MLKLRQTRRKFLRNCLASTGSLAAGFLLNPKPTFSAAAAVRTPVTITYWTFLDPKSPGPRQEGQNQVIANFMAANPDIKVEVVVVGYADNNTKLIQAEAAGGGPDVVRVFQPWLTQPVKANALAPLNDFIGKWPKDVQDDFLFPRSHTTYDGVTYGLLMETRASLLWYRKDILDKVGLPVPKSLDQLGQTAGKISTAGLIGYGISCSTQQNAASMAEWFHPLLWGAGAELFDKDSKAVINSEAGVRALQWVGDLVHKYKGAPESVASMTTDGQLDGVKSGTIAIVTDQSARLATARSGKDIGRNLLTATIPSPDGNKPSPTGASGYALTIGKNSKLKEAAWRFIEFYLSAQQQIVDAKIAGTLPSRKSTYQDAFFKTPEGAERKGWADYAAAYGRMPILPENYTRLLPLEALAAQKVILNRVDPKKALDEAVKTYNEELKS